MSHLTPDEPNYSITATATTSVGFCLQAEVQKCHNKVVNVKQKNTCELVQVQYSSDVGVCWSSAQLCIAVHHATLSTVVCHSGARGGNQPAGGFNYPITSVRACQHCHGKLQGPAGPSRVILLPPLPLSGPVSTAMGNYRAMQDPVG